MTPLRETPAVKGGERHVPSCEHGKWTFAGADYAPRHEVALPDRRASRPPAGFKRTGCTRSSRATSDRPAKLCRSRGAVERELGRLKHEWALLPLRVRRIERVRLHADLTILAKPATALSRARSVPLAT